MKYEEILDVLAPCGLNCGKCMAFVNGTIKEHSLKLKKALDGFEKTAPFFASINPIFENYNSFSDILDYMTKGSCNGCRNGECQYASCVVKDCYREKIVDFCFQCDEFPCDKTQYPERLHKKWLSKNQRMKELGVEAFYNETKDEPRY